MRTLVLGSGHRAVFSLAGGAARQATRRFTDILLAGALLAPVALQAAASRPEKALPPPPLNAPSVDASVFASRSKHAADELSARDGGPTSAVTELDTKIAAGDLQAAITRADVARDNKGRTSELPNVSAIEAIYDKGMAEGIAEAFVAKAELEKERGNDGMAVGHLREASRRGSADADYRLARLKAQKSERTDIDESSIVLLNQAAARGHSRAALELGLALDQGSWRVDQDRDVAVEPSIDGAVAWMERASLLGEPQAGFWLGLHYMKAMTGLSDPARHQALQYLLTIRQQDHQLKEPVSGKTFTELEAEGVIEPGLLGELRRREVQLAAAASSGRDSSGQRTTPGKNQKRYIDHQVLALVGDAAAKEAIYNLVGLSPYYQIAEEGAVVALASRALVPSRPPDLIDPNGWRIELLDDTGLIESFLITTIDVPAKLVRVDRELPSGLPKELKYRLVRYHSVFSTFGADNRAGLKPGVAGNFADEVIVFGTDGKKQRRLFFHADRLQWTDSITGESLTKDVEIEPTRALIVKRSEAGTLSLQVRGMRPLELFRFTPPDGVNLIPTRKNSFAEATRTTVRREKTVAAEQLSVLTNTNGAGGSWQMRNEKASNWWAEFGLESDSQIAVAGESAAILVNKKR